jgi:hypothetical protein
MKLSAPRCSCRPSAAAQRVAEEASARLLRLEASQKQQQQGLDVVGKQMEKLHTRVRLVKRDLTGPLKEASQGLFCSIFAVYLNRCAAKGWAKVAQPRGLELGDVSSTSLSAPLLFFRSGRVAG